MRYELSDASLRDGATFDVVPVVNGRESSALLFWNDRAGGLVSMSDDSSLPAPEFNRMIRLVYQASRAWGPLTIQQLRRALGITDTSSHAARSVAGTVSSGEHRRGWTRDGDKWIAPNVPAASQYLAMSCRRLVPNYAINVMRAIAKEFAR